MIRLLCPPLGRRDVRPYLLDGYGSDEERRRARAEKLEAQRAKARRVRAVEQALRELGQGESNGHERN